MPGFVGKRRAHFRPDWWGILDASGHCVSMTRGNKMAKTVGHLNNAAHDEDIPGSNRVAAMVDNGGFGGGAGCLGRFGWQGLCCRTFVLLGCGLFSNTEFVVGAAPVGR